MNGKVTYRQQYTRCGKQRCRKCKEGTGHGPYWYAYWSENGRTISKYIGIHPPEDLAQQEPQTLIRTEETATQASRELGVFARKTVPLPEVLTEAASGEGKARASRNPGESSGPQPLVRVYLLGHFRVERNEQDTWQMVANRTWQRRRARALLGCLLSQPGRRMGREQVMEALWPELDVETAANRLNGAVHELRQILEPEIERPAASTLLRLERDILMLADASAIWVDAEVFEALLNRINLTSDLAQVEQMLEEAWELYEGDYLLEELYSEWAAARRESLRRGWMGLLLSLAQVRSERGALTSAIEPLDRLLTADPTNETAVRRLMILLTQLDRRGEAIRAYKRLATILKREYESDPLLETIELYNALRQGQIQALRPLNETLNNPPTPRELPGHTLEKPANPLLRPPANPPAKALLASQPADPDPNTSSQHPPRPASPPGRHNLSPLIGRERELEAMQALLLAIHNLTPSDGRKKTSDLASRSRLAHCVIVMGETGIGKTRLAEELTQKAHTLGWRVAWTRAYEQESTVPYCPWTDILRTLLQDVPLNQLISMVDGSNDEAEGKTPGALNPATTTHAKLARLTSLLPELAPTQESQTARAQTPIAPDQERFHLWEAMHSLLNALAQSAPLLLVLDDLHWTDDSSLELLAYLARHQQNERIMLVGTCRDTELAQNSSLRPLLNDLRREQALVTFPLQPLTQAQIARLLAHLPHDLVRRIQSQAGGNPLFAEELARLSETVPGVQARGYSKGHPHYTSQLDEPPVNLSNTDGSSPLPLPETIAAVLERRLAKLGEACQALLSRAAVLGRSFEFSLLMRMTGETGGNEDTILDMLEEALRSGLLTEEVSGTRIAYHFWHPLIVSHLYERLSAARRAQLHRRAALALIEQTDNEARDAAVIVHHLSKYGQEKQRLAYYAEIAGNQALSLSAYSEALHYYGLALESLQSLHTSSPPAQENALHIAHFLECMAECNYALTNVEESLRQFEDALELHKAQQKDPGAFPAPAVFRAWQQDEAQIQSLIWRSIGRAWKYLGEFSLAHDCAQQGKQVLRESGILHGVAWACLEHLDGSTFWMEGNFHEARHYVKEAVRIYEETASQSQESPEPAQAASTNQQEPPVARMTHSRRVLLGDPLEWGRMHETLGVIAVSMGQYAEALHHLHTALRILESHDLIGAISQVCSNIGAAHSMRAEHAIATTYFKRALELSERTSDHRIRFLVTANLGEIAARNGDLQEAATWMSESVALTERISYREHISWSHTALAAIQLDLGDMREALVHIRRSLAGARALKSTTRIAFALVTLANWRVTRALSLSSQSSSQISNGLVDRGNPVCLSLLHSARAALERALHLAGIDSENECAAQIVLTSIYYHLGNLEHAYQQATRALEEARRNEMTHQISRAQRLLGEILAASGQDQEADASFEQALQTCKEHGLRLDYARTLHRYGQSLLRRSLQIKSARGVSAAANASLSRTGIDYLREAREIFITCQARLDLQWIEEILASPALLYEEA